MNPKKEYLILVKRKYQISVYWLPKEENHGIGSYKTILEFWKKKYKKARKLDVKKVDLVISETYATT